MSELADRLDIDLSRVSRQITHLEGQGAVMRRANPDDGRSCLVDVTDHGVSLVEMLTEAHAELISRATEGWSSEELDTLTSLLTRLRHGLTEQEGGSVGMLLEHFDAALRD